VGIRVRAGEHGISIPLVVRGRIDEVGLGEKEVGEELASGVSKRLDKAPHVHGGEGPVMRRGGARAVTPVVTSGSTSDEVAGTKQKGGGGGPEDHIPTGMEPAIKNATEDVLPARVEDLAGAGVAKRSSAVLGVGTTLGADHQFTTVEQGSAQGSARTR